MSSMNDSDLRFRSKLAVFWTHLCILRFIQFDCGRVVAPFSTPVEFIIDVTQVLPWRKWYPMYSAAYESVRRSAVSAALAVDSRQQRHVIACRIALTHDNSLRSAIDGMQLEDTNLNKMAILTTQINVDLSEVVEISRKFYLWSVLELLEEIDDTHESIAIRLEVQRMICKYNCSELFAVPLKI